MEPVKSSSAPESKVHFLDYWRIIRIRKTVIMAVFLLVLLTTTAVTFMLPKDYASTVRMEVGKDTTDIAPLLMGMQAHQNYDPYFIQTEFEKIRSQKVLYEVIERNQLRSKWAKRFNAEGELTTQDAFQLLQRFIDVRQFRNTSLIEIRVYSDDPKEAAMIANTIAEVYLAVRLEKSGKASTNSIVILEEQLKKQEKAVMAAQKEVDDLRMELQVGDIDLGGMVQLTEPETVRAMERERMAAEVMLLAHQAQLSELTNKNRAELIQTLPSTTQDQILIGLLEKLNAQNNERAAIAKDLALNHPRVVNNLALISNLTEQIDARVNGLISHMRISLSQVEVKVIGLSNKVVEAKNIDAKKMASFRPYFDKKRNLDLQQQIYQTISLRVLQEGVDALLPKSSVVDIIDKAEPDDRPVRPNIPLNLALGVIVGLMMGFGLAFFIEYLDTSVKTIDDVERALQAPVLGVIPQNVGTLIEEGPESPHAEAYRVLRTNVLFSRKDPTFNTLTVVSGGAGEGKSTTIFNLATVFAQNGHRVLIVDSDLRRPSLHKLMNVSNAVGLTNYLLKQNTLEEVIQTTTVPTLHFLPSGKLPSSSMGILNSAQMKEFIQRVKERYDFVFFDSPPIMGVSDASILASEVDMSLLVIQYRKYPQVMTIRAKQMVEKVGGHLLGVVLNNINISQDSYYYYYSGYYYDYYSKHDDDADSKKNGEGKKGAGDRTALDLKKKY